MNSRSLRLYLGLCCFTIIPNVTHAQDGEDIDYPPVTLVPVKEEVKENDDLLPRSSKRSRSTVVKEEVKEEETNELLWSQGEEDNGQALRSQDPANLTPSTSSPPPNSNPLQLNLLVKQRTNIMLNPQLLMSAAAKAFLAKDLERAIKILDLVILHSPEIFKGHALSQRGAIKLKLKSYSDALSDFNEAIKLLPGTAIAKTLHNRANTYKLMGEEPMYKQAALDDYAEALKTLQGPDRAVTLAARGFLNKELNFHTEALEDFTEAFKIESLRTTEAISSQNRKAGLLYCGHRYAELAAQCGDAKVASDYKEEASKYYGLALSENCSVKEREMIAACLSQLYPKTDF